MDAPPFFPKGTVSDFEAEWYGKALARMGERPLSSTHAGQRVVRFTLLPTWGNPLAVRFSRLGDAATIEGKRLDGQGGYDPGKLVEEGAAALSGAQAKELGALFDELGFAKLATAERTGGRDGSQWILEAVEGGTYHVVVRWSPRDYDTERRGLVPFVRVCEWLYRASPLKGTPTNKGHVEIERNPKGPTGGR